jgi:hypothetical protein
MEPDQIQRFVQRHNEHIYQLAALQSCQKEVFHTAAAIDLTGEGNFSMLPQVAIYTIVMNIDDLNRGILSCLESRCYSAAESLARSSLENSINLLCLVDDVTTTRCRSLLKSYLGQTRKRAGHWLTFAKSDDDPKTLARAQGFVNHLAMMTKIVRDFDGKKPVPGWPDARSRFRSVDLESLYHVLFAPASDSVHGFSEDIFNNTITELVYKEAGRRKTMHEATQAEKLSFAYYLAANAVAVFGEAILHLAERANRPDLEDAIVKVGEKIASVIIEHESVSDFYFKAWPTAEENSHD